MIVSSSLNAVLYHISAIREGSMSSQQSSSPLWFAVGLAWFAGFLCATAMWEILMDFQLEPGHGQALPWWARGGIGLFIGAFLTLSAYFLTRVTLNARE
jgi:hypothetical protein